MVLWRISIFNDLVGMGGEFGKGRWHSPAKGRRIVYLAEHPSLALLETLVNLKERPEDGADRLQLMRIEAPDDLHDGRIGEESLPENWREDSATTRALGDDWLEQGKTVLLAVPSAPSPESTNYLFNPLHRDAARFRVAWSRWIHYDKRFFRTRV